MALADGNSKIDPKQKLKPDQTQQVDASDVQDRPLDPPHS
jgi:hypothetical protein